MECRLAALLAADVVGDSRLLGKVETAFESTGEHKLDRTARRWKNLCRRYLPCHANTDGQNRRWCHRAVTGVRTCDIGAA